MGFNSGFKGLILSSHLLLGLQSSSPSSLPTKIMYAPPLSPIRTTCYAHHILLDLIGEEYRS